MAKKKTVNSAKKAIMDPIYLPTHKAIDEEAAALTGAITYALLAGKRHPEYREDFWARSRAFYKGGVHLLENDAVLERVFPRHVGEKDEVYDMRKKLAHYTNHSGSIVNHLIGKLMGDPVRLQAEPEMDDFYTGFQKDTSPPNGKECSLDDLVGKVLLEAAQTQCGYALVEMPQKLDDEAKSLAEQEASGALDAWVVEVKAESVVDWEVDKSGEYVWVLLCFKDSKRDSVYADRNTITETYWMYNQEGWVRWDVEYRADTPPKGEDVILPAAVGTHTFGKVPLAKLQFSDGLWIMSKLESLAREFFNKRNALSWAEFKALMPVLYEYLDPGTMPQMSGPAGADNRATNQKRSTAHVQQRRAGAGQGDSAVWVSPPDAPFAHALTSCESIRDEMHRVVQQMALSADNKGSLLRRSAESKQKDTDALDVVLGEYGKLARRFVVELLQLVEAGRGDKPREWTASGASNFDSSSTDALIEEETVLDAVEMPSPTFKAERKKQLARKVLGDSVTEDKLAEIDEEIENFFSNEGLELDEEVNGDTPSREEVRAGLEAEEDDEKRLEEALTRGKSNGMVISSFKGSK